MKEPGTQFDKLKSIIQNNPIVASLMVVGMIIIALSTFTDAAKNLLDMVIKETRPNINGEWMAEVTYPWSKVSYVEVFSFNGDDDNIVGVASFLGGKQVIFDGKIKNGRIEFKTTTTESEGSTSKLSTHHYRGIILENQIKFVLENYGGFSSGSHIEFIANKAPPNKAN